MWVSFIRLTHRLSCRYVLMWRTFKHHSYYKFVNAVMMIGFFNLGSCEWVLLKDIAFWPNVPDLRLESEPCDFKSVVLTSRPNLPVKLSKTVAAFVSMADFSVSSSQVLSIKWQSSETIISKCKFCLPVHNLLKAACCIHNFKLSWTLFLV